MHKRLSFLPPLLLATLLAATLPATTLPAAAQTAGPGAATWEAACATCHDDVTALIDPGADPEETAASLDGFLAEHFAPDPDARAELIAWLIAQGAE